MTDLKARASRNLTRAGFEDVGRHRWTRQGSTIHRFNEENLAEKIHYTLEEQGERMALVANAASNHNVRLANQHDELSARMSIDELTPLRF